MQKEDLHPYKDLLPSEPKGSRTRWWLNSGKTSAKDPGFQELDKYKSTIALCTRSQNEMVHFDPSLLLCIFL